VLDHDVERPAAEDVWAFDVGLSDLLYLTAFNKPELGEQEARAVERSAVAIGRLADSAARSAGDVGIRGPDPRANTMRIARRRNRRRADRSVPTNPQPFDPETGEARIREIFGVMARAMATMPQAGGVDQMTRVAETVFQRFDNLSQRFGELEARGRAETLWRCMAVGLHHRQVSTEALEGVEQAEDVCEIAPIVRGYSAFIDRALEFVVELAEAPSAEEAEAALDRFATAVIP
jgi:hypothetical protein